MLWFFGLFMILLSMLMGLGTSNWFVMIFMMELGMLLLVLMSNNVKKLLVSSSILKYFIVQSLGGILILMSGSLILFLQHVSSLPCMFFAMGLFLKLGSFPFFFWVIPVFLNLPYLMLGILGTVLKVLPLSGIYMINMLMDNMLTNMISFIGLLSIMVGVLLGLQEPSMRGFLGASAISHTGWILLASLSGSLIMYFMCYSLSYLLVLYMLNNKNYWLGSIAMIGLGGLPPSSVFLGKMIIIINSLNSFMSIMIVVTALVSSAISLFYYLKFAFYLLMINTNKKLNWNMIMPVLFNFFFGLGFLFLVYFLWPS